NVWCSRSQALHGNERTRARAAKLRGAITLRRAICRVRRSAGDPAEALSDREHREDVRREHAENHDREALRAPEPERRRHEAQTEEEIETEAEHARDPEPGRSSEVHLDRSRDPRVRALAGRWRVPDVEHEERHATEDDDREEREDLRVEHGLEGLREGDVLDEGDRRDDPDQESLDETVKEESAEEEHTELLHRLAEDGPTAAQVPENRPHALEAAAFRRFVPGGSGIPEAAARRRGIGDDGRGRGHVAIIGIRLERAPSPRTRRDIDDVAGTQVLGIEPRVRLLKRQP